MDKAQQYREQVRRCDLLLETAAGPIARQRLRRERQDWVELAASADAARRDQLTMPLDLELTLQAMRAFEAAPGKARRQA